MHVTKAKLNILQTQVLLSVVSNDLPEADTCFDWSKTLNNLSLIVHIGLGLNLSNVFGLIVLYPSSVLHKVGLCSIKQAAPAIVLAPLLAAPLVLRDPRLRRIEAEVKSQVHSDIWVAG